MKGRVSFTDKDLKKIQPRLANAAATSTMPKDVKMEDLNNAFDRYHKMAHEWSTNCTHLLLKSVRTFIHTDDKISDIFDDEAQSFKAPAGLEAACLFIDVSKRTAEFFKAGIWDDFEATKLSLMPNKGEIIAALNTLMTDLSGPPITDFDPFKARVDDLIKKLNAASDFIQQNMEQLKFEFIGKVNERSRNAERELKMNSKASKLFPDSVKSAYSHCIEVH